MVKRLIRFACKDPNAIILDSFAGSGTTAHAVLELNKDEKTNYKFILIETEDYANELTAERVRRVIKGIPKLNDKKLRNGLGGSFSFFRLGEPIEIEAILKGTVLPKYEDLARYIFFTATGEEFDNKKVDEEKYYIGESKEYEIYLLYKTRLRIFKSNSFKFRSGKKFR